MEDSNIFDYGFRLPDVMLPKMDLPGLQIPSTDGIPTLHLESTNFPVFDSEIAFPIFGLLSVFVLGVLASRSSDGVIIRKEESAKKAAEKLLAIPYHAPAKMAYQAWLEDHSNEVYDEAAYQSFEKLYEAQAIAEATAKKLGRDLKRFDNKPIPEPIAAQEAPLNSLEKSKGNFFFAN